MMSAFESGLYHLSLLIGKYHPWLMELQIIIAVLFWYIYPMHFLNLLPV